MTVNQLRLFHNKNKIKEKYMKLMVLVLVTLFVSQSAYAAQKNWETETVIDEMTDKKSCRLHAPYQDGLALSFQGDKLYFVTNMPLTFDDLHMFTLRVDKNEKFNVMLDVAAPNMMVVRDSLNVQRIIKEFKAGNKFIIQSIALNTLAHDKGTLTGFTKHYNTYKSCLAN